MRTKMNITNMLMKPHYNSIYELTLRFQNKENGLQSKHYRYALVKDDKNKKRLLYLKSFFLDADGNDILEELKKHDKIQEDCITGDNLKNFLKLMVDKGILEITNPNETVKKYKIPTSILNGLFNERTIRRLERWENDKIFPTDRVIDPSRLKLSDEKTITGIIYGFPSFVFYENIFPKNDMKIIKENLFNIYKEIIEINEILCKHSKGGIGKISLVIESAIQPQLKEYFKAVDEKMKIITKNMKKNFRG